MKFAIYARTGKKINTSLIEHFFNLLEKYQIDYFINENFLQALNHYQDFNIEPQKAFQEDSSIEYLGVNFVVSLGGDGTLLDTLTLVQNTEIPVIGLNTGRLGFLANIPKETLDLAIQDLFNEHYSVESRTLLKLSANKHIFPENNFALNDFTIHKRDKSSMVTVETYLDGEYFNVYWADGIIAATPTGSTGYSLSCGGPIIFPNAQNIILTPVAPHNLNIRPIILPDTSTIQFKVTGRGTNYLASLDSRYEVLDYSYELTVCKAPFSMKLVKLDRQSFIQTLREKLKWGVDTRNQ